MKRLAIKTSRLTKTAFTLESVFMFMVMYAPGGIASLIMMNVRVAMYRRLGRLLPWYLALGATAFVMLAGGAALIELVYHLQFGASVDPTLHRFGLTFDVRRAASWLGPLAVALAGYAMFEITRRRFGRVWGDVQGEIAALAARREAA